MFIWENSMQVPCLFCLIHWQWLCWAEGLCHEEVCNWWAENSLLVLLFKAASSITNYEKSKEQITHLFQFPHFTSTAFLWSPNHNELQHHLMHAPDAHGPKKILFPISVHFYVSGCKTGGVKKLPQNDSFYFQNSIHSVQSCLQTLEIKHD